MPKNNNSILSPDTITFRMRPGLMRLQVIFCAALGLFSLVIFVMLFFRQEKTLMEYFFWLAGLGLWCYAIWYALSARLTINSSMVQFTAAASKMKVAWNQIGAFGIEASGPVLYVQDSNQAQEPSSSRAQRNKRKKVPLYLFMQSWKSMEDWNRDPVGQEILSHAAWLFKENPGS